MCTSAVCPHKHVTGRAGNMLFSELHHALDYSESGTGTATHNAVLTEQIRTVAVSMGIKTQSHAHSMCVGRPLSTRGFVHDCSRTACKEGARAGV